MPKPDKHNINKIQNLKNMKRTEIKELLERRDFGSSVVVMGWVRTKRVSKNVGFIALNDGSTINNVQIVVDMNDEFEKILDNIHTGAALKVEGKLVESLGSGQKVEISAEKIEIFGKADPKEYPLQPKRHTLEFLREKAHLRFRTNTFSAIARVRHTLIFAIHKFFNDRGFYNIHTPIITGSDAEGAGEMFQVTTLDLDIIPKDEEGKINFKEDFFGKPANLTVSGQLEAELAALALGKVYTFGPTFRAENSNTARHLAEFWMIEPEMAFFDINDDMDLAEEMLKYVVKYVLDNTKTSWAQPLDLFPLEGQQAGQRAAPWSGADDQDIIAHGRYLAAAGVANLAGRGCAVVL